METVVDNTLYHLDKYAETRTIGGNDFSVGTTASGRFLILYFTVENMSNETRNITLSVSKLKDSDGNEYDTSNDGEAALSMSAESAELFVTQVQPHLPKKVVIVFDVPASQKAFDLTIPKTLFGTGESGHITFHL